MHIVINEKSEIIAIKITQGNIDDRKVFEEMATTKGLQGKCYADRGYISQNLPKRFNNYHWYKEKYEGLPYTTFGQNYAQKKVHYRNSFWLY